MLYKNHYIFIVNKYQKFKEWRARIMAKKKLLWINPLGTNIYDAPISDYLNTATGEDTHIDVVSLEKGPHHLEYYSYEAFVLPDILKTIKQAEKDNYDATIIGCFYDPGLLEAREISEKMCVTAPAEACMHIVNCTLS